MKPGPRFSDANQQFYSRYGWCVNPLLSLQELLYRLGEEMESAKAASKDWERQEHRINIYLFACAIACTIDDYLGRRRRLPAIFRRLPLAHLIIPLAEWLLNLPRELRSDLFDGPARRWRREWSHSVDAACEALLGSSDSGLQKLAAASLASAAHLLGEKVLDSRMRIPEGFRCQDLAHFDVCSMVDRALPALENPERPVVILGPRTAGAYFAPLAAAHLRSRNFTRVHWMTARPKIGFSGRERRQLVSFLASGALVLVIDDHQNTGNTMRLLTNALIKLNVNPRDIFITIPGHPSSRGWDLLESAQGIRIFVLPHEESHKARLLASQWGHEILSDYFPQTAPSQGGIAQSRATASTNCAFTEQCADGFQVRLKRLFERCAEDRASARRVLAKSVGWGWLGYHAWVAASALKDFVPRPIALQQGILFSEWVEGQSLDLTSELPDRLARQIGSYVGFRTAALPLWEDPSFDSPGYRSGWDELVTVLRGVFGYAGRLKTSAIRRHLQFFLAPQPTLVDGRMEPANWIRLGGRLMKTDFEHHNFGGGELNLVDPAWDLASAIFEFQLSGLAENQMLRSYVEATGDVSVNQRLLLYKILYAAYVNRVVKYWLARNLPEARKQELNRRHMAASNFASFHLARYCGRNLPAPAAAWSKRLLFLDLDGVLHWEFLGFPHTTPNGVRALYVLHRAGVSTVLNTNRSVQDVREYCRAYHLPGGVAEHGSVFWDAVHGSEIPLIDAESRQQLETFLGQIRNSPGILIDPSHQFSIRAYRLDGRSTAVKGGEIEERLAHPEFRSLTFKHNGSHTLIVSKAARKGAALAAVKTYLGCSGEIVAAIGDSDQDVDMLAAADMAYAPANASAGVCALIPQGQCRRTRHRLQAGLLEAALELSGGDCYEESPQWRGGRDANSLIDDLLSVADRNAFVRVACALLWRDL
jgi:hydroxymethylpyrimidine pyrophosphatase-like HAD family hydrolase/orotate phosphoribosyltransferase